MIDTIKQEELGIKQEELLKNMKMLHHNALDILGSEFFKGLIPEPHNGMITVHDDQFPIYISSNVISAKEQEYLPKITDDILDKSNYLSLLTNDDVMWYALVEYLGHQADLLQEDNIKYEDELIDANFKIDKLECKVADEVEARQKLEEENRILRGKYNNLRGAFNSTYGMSIANNKDMRQSITNEAMSELVARINELEKENESLKDENNKYKEVLTAVDDALSEANTILEGMVLNDRKETKNR